MNRYGIVVYPEEGNGAQFWPAMNYANGLYAPAMYDDEDVNSRQKYPVAIFFETAEGRDVELTAMVSRWPNVMFCPITVEKGFKTQPNPKATAFEFSNKGILPA